MVILLIIVGLAVFLFGLIQWARGGAALWFLLRLKRGARPSNPLKRAWESAEIRRAEKATDQLLRSSFKVIGILAIGMWLFLGLTVLLDLLGVDWVSRISTRAQTFWGSPVYNRTPATTQSPARRGDIMKSLRNSLGK